MSYIPYWTGWESASLSLQESQRRHPAPCDALGNGTGFETDLDGYLAAFVRKGDRAPEGAIPLPADLDYLSDGNVVRIEPDRSKRAFRSRMVFGSRLSDQSFAASQSNQPPSVRSLFRAISAFAPCRRERRDYRPSVLVSNRREGRLFLPTSPTRMYWTRHFPAWRPFSISVREPSI